MRTLIYIQKLNIAPKVFNLYWNIVMLVLPSGGWIRSSCIMNDHQNAWQKALFVVGLYCKSYNLAVTVYQPPPPLASFYIFIVRC